MTCLTASAWITETPVELIADGDFDGDGQLDIIIVDKASGAVRVAFQSGAQELSWQPAFASGIANATSLAVGRLSSTSWDSIAVTSPEANRINKFDPQKLLTASGLSPVSIYPPGVGPELVVGLDVGGVANTSLDDFFVTSSENPGVAYGLLRNTGSSTTIIEQGTLPGSFTGVNRLEIKAGQGFRVGGFFRANPLTFSDSFQVWDFSAGTFAVRLNFDMPVNGANFVAHRFSTNNPLAQILFYIPGTSDLTKYQFQETGAGFTLAGSNSFRLTGRLQLMVPLLTTTGARLIGFFGQDRTNLTSATIYSFDGTNAPRALQTYTGTFSAAGILGNGHAVLLKSDSSGRSTAYQVVLANGNSYSEGTSGGLPPVTRFSGSANALLFEQEPFVNSAARPRQFQHHADWTTGLRVTPTIQVTGQQFLDSTSGLRSATMRDFGSPVSGVTTGLINQYLPAVSVFSARPAVGTVEAEVRIAPPGGHYAEAQRLSLSTNGVGTWQIWFRTGFAKPWTVYTTPFLLFSNATVEFYARRLADNSSTPIGQATYTFSLPAKQLDSDHDGVPDFVEQSRGLDPRGGTDSDHDGFSDLEELARGYNPLSSASKPATDASFKNAFNRLVAPRPPHPNTGAPVKSLTGVPMELYALGGPFLGSSETSATNGTGLTNPAALFQNVMPGPHTVLTAETTHNHFNVLAFPKTRAGRELIGLVPVPATNEFTVNYIPGSGSDFAEATGWIIAASNALAASVNPTTTGLLTPDNALVAALFEAKVTEALLQRGTNGATNATLFGFRTGDADRYAINSETLRDLAGYAGASKPAYRELTLFDSLDGNVRTNAAYSTLVSLARELWRISAAQDETNLQAFPLPFDELRSLISNQKLSPAYLAYKSVATNAAGARSQATSLLASVPQRPVTNTTLIITSTSQPDAIQLATTDGHPVSLWRFDGASFAFPPNFQLLAGSQIGVFAYTDLPPVEGSLAWEVISVAINAVPMPSPGDADGNLLVDSWENVFFGRTGIDPFGDADADGYSNLQEMLAGTEPNDVLGVPPTPPLHLIPPAILLSTEGNQIKLTFKWPTQLFGQLKFELQAAADVGGAYTSVPNPPLVAVGADEYEFRLQSAPVPTQFYRIVIRLGE